MKTSTNQPNRSTLTLLTAALIALIPAGAAMADDPSGACCYEDPDLGGLVCVEVSPNQCDELGGYYYGVGTSCSDPFVECDPMHTEGACCFNDPAMGWTCAVVEEYKCDDLGGTWYAGMSCSDPLVDCDPIIETGACCYNDPAFGLVCDTMIEEFCVDLSGYWYGPGTVCSDPFVECDPLPSEGACCVQEGDSGFWYCIETTQSDCDGQLGVWYGLGSHCTDPGINCDPIDECDAIPGSDCAGRPHYDDQGYQSFGGGRVAVQTVSPAIPGDRMLTVFDLTGIGSQPFDTSLAIGRYANANWTSANLGSILGLAIDEEGNIFVTATQTWNYDVAGPSGWAAVYRIDTNSGAISTFAVLPTSGSSLGSITYDCEHGQFFVSSFEDGLIYRLDYATGSVLDTFDHGTPWSGNAGPVALGDRPFAVEVNGDHLYYSLWNVDYNNPSPIEANEIWSVKLDGTGMPQAGTEELEITIPEYYADGNFRFSSPVADMDFSPTGTLVLGERSQVGITNISAHQARVLEYECEGGIWVLTPHIFHVGQIQESAAGGVDANERRVWASGDAMHIGASDNIYGFQGLPAAGGSPTDSWLIDYNGDLSIQDKTLLGDLVVTKPEGTMPAADCPVIQVLDVDCIGVFSPFDFDLHLGVSNMDATQVITSVTMTPPTGMSLTPDHVTMALPPLHSWPFDSVLSGAAQGSEVCIDFEVQFGNGATCTETICIELPMCIIVLPGDFDLNGVVDVDDLMIVISRWGEICDGLDNDCDGVDVDGSGTVDMGDLLEVLANWSL
ncbi:MAG TPA: hypothetical protein QF800_01315 [Phycisphaerales bacterium]|nr:hypothetical protein [Phycisphaerales bacterium]